MGATYPYALSLIAKTAVYGFATLPGYGYSRRSCRIFWERNTTLWFRRFAGWR